MRKTLAALLLFLPTLVNAHDRGFTDAENEWLDRQRSVDGTKCCDRHDAFVGHAVEWRLRGGNYEVEIDGTWFQIRPGAMLVPEAGDPTPWPGQALLFYSRNPGYRGGVMIWCFMPEPLM